MADLLSYLMPGTGNWASGVNTTSQDTSTTQKYFNPQAIIDQLNRYSQRLGGTSALNQMLLYGKSGAAASAGPYKVPAASASQPAYFSPAKKPVTPAAAPPPAGVTPTPAAPVPTPTPTPVAATPIGGDPDQPKHTPDQPLYPAGTFSSMYFKPATPVGATPESYGETPASASKPAPGEGPVTDLGGDKGIMMDNPGLGGGTPVTHPAVAAQPPDTTGAVPNPAVPPGGSPGSPTPATPVGGRPGPATPVGASPSTPEAPPPDTGGGDQGGGGGLMDIIQQLIGGGGYSPAEKQAIAERAAEVTQAQKGSAQAQMASHLAASGNAAGYGGAMASLDNSAAQTASDQARQDEIDFANEAERRKELGANVMQQLYGINTAADLGYMGQNTGLASLVGGVDTHNTGKTAFENQGFQATPDSSANKPSTAAKPGTSGGASAGKPGDPGPKPGTVWGQNGQLYDKYGNALDSKTGWPVDEHGNPIEGAYYSDKGQLFDKDGNALDSVSGWPVDENGNPIGPDGTVYGEPDHNGLMPGDPGYGEGSPGDEEPPSDETPPEETPIEEPPPGEEPPPIEEPPPEPIYDPPTYDDGEELRYDPLAALRRLMS